MIMNPCVSGVVVSQSTGLLGPLLSPCLGWKPCLLGRELEAVLLPTPPSWLGSPKTKLAKNICVGGGKLTFPPLSSFLETVATVKYSKTEAGMEQARPLQGVRELRPRPSPTLAASCHLVL